VSLTFLAVHAHPDDEASSTGGVFRLYKNQGVRTVLVTCTNGEYGDAPGGIKPLDPHHDPEAVVAVRTEELARSAEILGIDRVVRLGYRDSGMMRWPQNSDPKAFWSTPIDEAAERVAAIMRDERPQVVMTYNEFGFYGHPDHIQAHRVTVRALELVDYEPTLYFNAIPDSVMAMMRERFENEAREMRAADIAQGLEPEPEGEPDMTPEEEIRMGTPDALVSATIDVRSVTDAKYDALAAHASQTDGSFWLRMSREEFAEAMGTEWFVRATNPLGLTGTVGDLFAGYRTDPF